MGAVCGGRGHGLLALTLGVPGPPGGVRAGAVAMAAAVAVFAVAQFATHHRQGRPQQS